MDEQDFTASDQALSENFKSPFIFTVSELAKSLQSILRSNFSSLWVKGEISEVVTSGRGHVYFKLKDSDAILSSVIFAPQLQQDKQISTKLIQGTIIECRGSVSFYTKQGTCQLIVEEVRAVGLGELQLAFLAQREAFMKAGLFAAERKRSLPIHAYRIGLITSLTGAVLRDMMKILTKPSPHGAFALTLYDTPVQGARAPSQIVKQIKRANAEQTAEILILARGGGSLEELSGFNDPQVVQSVCDSQIPIVSAIGHETDWVLTDEAADYRVSTPTAAAELLLKNRLLGVQALLAALETSRNLIKGKLQLFHDRLRMTALQRLQTLLSSQIKLQSHKLKMLSYTGTQALTTHFHRKQQTQMKLSEVLRSLSPKGILKRGYAVIERNKTRISRADTLNSTDSVTLTFQDGHRKATID